MKFSDSLLLDGGSMRKTTAGYAVLEARVAKAGNVQLYDGSELGFPDKGEIRVYRPADQVFHRDAIKTYAGVPVTLGHPRDGVDAASWRDVAVGEVGDEVMRDGAFVRVPMMLRDAAAIRAVESGVRELSMGYDAQLVFRDGVTPDGEAYDAVMTDFRMNHVALVNRARGGQELRIGDGTEKWGASPVTTRKESAMTDIKLRTVVVGDEAVSTTDEGARAIERLKGEVKGLEAQLAKAVADGKAALTAKDEELGRVKADLKTAQDAAAIDIDKLVAERTALIDAVRTLDSSIAVDGLTAAELRKAAVVAKLGDGIVADASEAEIAGMFKALTKDAKPTDPVAHALRHGVRAQPQDAAKDAQDAWQKSVTDLNAWRKEG